MRALGTLMLAACLAAPALAGGDDDEKPPELKLESGGDGVAWVLTGEERFETGPELTPDGKLIAFGQDEWVFTIEAATGKVVRKWHAGKRDPERLAWSPDGVRLVSATRDGIRCYDAKSGKPLWVTKGHEMQPPAGYKGRYPRSEYGVANDVCFNGDGTRVASVSNEATNVRVFDAGDGSLVKEVELGFPEAERCTTTPDGSLLVVVADRGPLAAINWPDLSLRWVQKGKHQLALTISGDSKWIACAPKGGTAGVVAIRRSIDGNQTGSFSPVGDWDIGGVDFTAGNKGFIAAGAGNGLNPLVVWPFDSPDRPAHVLHKNYPVYGLVRAGTLVIAAARRKAKELRAFKIP